MHGGQTRFLYDVLYASKTHQNLVSVLVLLKQGFNLNFHKSGFVFGKKLLWFWFFHGWFHCLGYCL